MEELPNEVWHNIFSSLCARDLLNATWTCRAWRGLLVGNQIWWREWFDHRWPGHLAITEANNTRQGPSAPEPVSTWQQYSLTRALHIAWRYKPVACKSLLYTLGRQDGWDRRGRPPAVLVEGNWALLTCTPGRAGPSGGRDRLQLVRLTSPDAGPDGNAHSQVAISLRPRYWLDFGTNQYKPYALQGGATDLHLPFVAQGRASDVFVWKADQQDPIAILSLKCGVTVPALAIERTPYGQHKDAEGVRLATCTDSGQVFVWLVDSRGLTPNGTLLWTGMASELCGAQHASCQVGALAMWSLARPTSSFRTSCCVAIGMHSHGVTLLTLNFTQQRSSTAVCSQATQHIPHTAPALTMCVSWDHSPPVCNIPCPEAPQKAKSRATLEQDAADAQAREAVGLPPIAPNASITGTLGFRQSVLHVMPSGHDQPQQHQQHLQQQQQQQEGITKEGACAETRDVLETPTTSAAAAAEAATAQQHCDALAAACDRTHLFIVWGLTSFTQPEASGSGASVGEHHMHLVNQGSSQQSSEIAAAAAAAADIDSRQPTESAAAGAGDAAVTVSDSNACQHGFRAQTSADDLVARLRRLRPQLHATGPCSPKSPAAAAATGSPTQQLSQLSSSPAKAAAAAAAAAAAVAASPAQQLSQLSSSPAKAAAVAAASPAQQLSQQESSPVKAAADAVQQPGQSSSLKVDVPQAFSNGKAPLSSQQHLNACDSSCGTSTDANALSTGARDERPTQSDVSLGCSNDQCNASTSESDRASFAGQASAGNTPWTSLKGHYSLLQMEALHLGCNTVACFDILSCTAPIDQSSRAVESSPAGDAGAVHSGPAGDARADCSSPAGDQRAVNSSPAGEQGAVCTSPTGAVQATGQGCWVRPLWKHPIVDASHMSAGDGAVAVACSDGMLLLLDQATGQLIRRIPNTQVDERLSRQQPSGYKAQMTFGSESVPGLKCTVWWGCLGSRSPALSSHSLTVVTEMPMEGSQRHHPKELCIEQYSCALADKPDCWCNHQVADGAKHSSVSLRTTLPPAMGSSNEPESCLSRLRHGSGDALINMHMLGIELPHQSLSRRYWSCSRKQNRPADQRFCAFGRTAYFD